jgi:hypothetical protein
MTKWEQKKMVALMMLEIDYQIALMKMLLKERDTFQAGVESIGLFWSYNARVEAIKRQSQYYDATAQVVSSNNNNNKGEQDVRIIINSNFHTDHY